MADNAIAHATETAPIKTGDAFISMIERAATNPAVDIDKMERLYEMHERVLQRESRRDYFEAMAEMQPCLPVIEHTKRIAYMDSKTKVEVVKGTYTPWEDIDEQIRPHYTAHGFSLSFRIQQPENAPIEVTCIVMHRAGHFTETTIRLPSDTSGSKNTVQGIGSAITYGKRYAACAALNITTRGAEGETDDDDGEAAARPMNASQAKKHQLWETLTGELANEVSNQVEADEWLNRTKQHRAEYRQMPVHWRKMFYEEFFLPFREKLPGVV